jgi:phosphatidylserine/phosphatidylglycerophosphate/cardiolipin synthase-like enzyme
MASFADGKIQAFVGLPELGAADDLEQVIVEFIAGAKTRLDIAVQEIDSRAIAQAILDARWRGVRVTIFLDQDYLRSDLVGSPQAPNAHGGGESGGGVAAGAVAHRRDRLSGDREILAALLRSDIEVKGDYNPTIFHQTFILRDYDGKATATSALLSGSANFTWTDTHSNLNNVFVFRNAYMSAAST